MRGSGLVWRARRVTRRARFIWLHLADDRPRTRRIAAWTTFKARSRINPRHRQQAPIGTRLHLWADNDHHAAEVCVWANPPNPGEMTAWRKLLQPGDLFIDVGANIGTYSLWAADLGANVIAIEPVPEAAHRLNENIALNSLDDQITVFSVAITSDGRDVWMTTGRDTENAIADEGNGTLVPSRTLDSIVDTATAAGVKIDVEGHEHDVLLGATAALAEQRIGALQLEWNDKADRRPIAQLLRGYGYVPSVTDPVGNLSRCGWVTTASDLFVTPFSARRPLSESVQTVVEASRVAVDYELPYDGAGYDPPTIHIRHHRGVELDPTTGASFLGGQLLPLSVMARPVQMPRSLPPIRTRPGRFLSLLHRPYTSHGNLYHWLIEMVPRVVALDDQTTTLLVPDDLSEYQRRLLDAVARHQPRIDVPRGRIRWRLEELTEIDLGILPNSGWLPDQVRVGLRRRLLEGAGVGDGSGRRIFVSRADAAQRRLVNEAEVLKALEPDGFEVVHLERMSATEQLSAFAHADIVVSPHGSGLAHLVVSPPGQLVVELQSSRPMTHYALLAESAGLRYRCVLGTAETADEDLSVDADAVLAALR